MSSMRSRRRAAASRVPQLTAARLAAFGLKRGDGLVLLSAQLQPLVVAPDDRRPAVVRR